MITQKHSTNNGRLHVCGASIRTAGDKNAKGNQVLLLKSERCKKSYL